MFAYVFGSAISIPGGDYHAYLVSGIFAQSMIGTVPGISVGVASDIRSGLMDRLRTLPIWSGSVIAGRTIAEMVELAGGIVVVALCGLIVGWAPHGTVLETAGAFGLLLLSAFAFTWAGMFLGLIVRDPDGADGIAMSFIFPLMFLSGIFVPVARPPHPAAPDRGDQPADLAGHRAARAVRRGHRPAPRRVDAPAPGAGLARLGRRPDGDLRAAVGAPLQADGPLALTERR